MGNLLHIVVQNSKDISLMPIRTLQPHDIAGALKSCRLSARTSLGKNWVCAWGEKKNRRISVPYVRQTVP